MTTLADIVNAALSDSEGSLKLASARDAVPAKGSDLDFLDAELPAKLASDDDSEDDGHRPPPKKDEKDKKDEPEKKASHSEIVSDADFAMKLAEALTIGSNIVSAKLANEHSHLDAPGPQVHQGDFHTTPTTSPKAHSTVTPTISGPSTHGPAGLPTDKADFTRTGDQSGRAKNHPGKTAGDEAWTKSKTASLSLLRAKVAQAEVFMNLGQHTEAEKLLNEVKAAQEKMAQDPSSPQPSMPGHSDSFKLDTEPGPSSHIGDNASLISATKSGLKDKTTREASQYISETPKKDNAVPAHTLRTDGQKISSLVVPRKKVAAAQPTPVPAPAPAAPEPTTKKASFDPEVARAYLGRLVKTAGDPEATQADREKAASTLKSIKDKLGISPETLLS